MKILFVTAKYYPDGAGAGRSVRNLAQIVTVKGHEAVVVRLTPNKEKIVETISGVKIYHLPLRNIYWPSTKKRNVIQKLCWHVIDAFNPLAMKDLARILKAEQPDIVNTNIIAGFSAGIFYTIKKAGIPLVHTMRDYYLLSTNSGLFRNGKPIRHIYCLNPFVITRRLSARNVDLFLANSAHVLDRHKDAGLINECQQSCVQFNMNEDDYITKPKLSNKNTHRFGFIGRVDPTKGLEVLLQATQTITDKEFSLRIAGDGNQDYIEQLKKQYPDPRIQFIGFTEADKFYEQIHTLICPSIYEEPLPRVVYEAYAKALPVIVSDAGGTPEIVELGKTGLIYPATDAYVLAENMIRIIDDVALYKNLSKGAAQKAELFTKTKVTDDYLLKVRECL